MLWRGLYSQGLSVSSIALLGMSGRELACVVAAVAAREVAVTVRRYLVGVYQASEAETSWQDSVVQPGVGNAAVLREYLVSGAQPVAVGVALIVGIAIGLVCGRLCGRGRRTVEDEDGWRERERRLAGYSSVALQGDASGADTVGLHIVSGRGTAALAPKARARGGGVLE